MNPYKKKSIPRHKTITLLGKVVMRDNELTVELLAPHLRRHFLKTYCKVGDHMSITLVNKKPIRTASQNNFYHLYLSLVSISSGHTMAELKDWVREKILSKGVREVYGETVRITKSSADLNISEFVEMMETIKEKTGVPIPDPSPFNLPLTYDEYGKLKEKQVEKYQEIKPKKFIKPKKKKNETRIK